MKLEQKVSSLFISFMITFYIMPSFAQSDRASVINACRNLSFSDEREACLQGGIDDASAINACRNFSFSDERKACLQGGINDASVINACRNFSFSDEREACLQGGIDDASTINACRNFSFSDERKACLSPTQSGQNDNNQVLQKKDRYKWMYLTENGYVGFLEMFGNSGFLYITSGDGMIVIQEMILKNTRRGGIVLDGEIVTSGSYNYVSDRLYLNDLLKQNMFGENCDGINACTDFELIYLGEDTN